MTRLDDGVLMALADGELDAEARREVEAALAADPAARDRLAALRDSARLVLDAFDEGQPLREPVPRRLVAGILRSGGRRGGVARWAAAAALAGLVVGFGAGQWTTPQDRDGAAAPALLAVEAAMTRDLSRVLESERSGSTATWQDAAVPARAAVTPMRSFRDAAGGYCREYRQELALGDYAQTRYGIACRIGEADWRTRLLVLADAGGNDLAGLPPTP